MKVLCLSKDDTHRFSKRVVDTLTFLQGLGIEGDAHCGATVKHLSRVKVDPTQINLRQVHLIHTELLSELRVKGFNVTPGTLRENVLTEGIDLLALPTNTLLKLGNEVLLRVTGLRNPCAQLDNYQSGLTQAVLGRDDEGNIIRKAGIMAVVEQGGRVSVNDPIEITLPAPPHQRLERV